jgi:hypothetical protein
MEETGSLQNSFLIACPTFLTLAGARRRGEEERKEEPDQVFVTVVRGATQRWRVQEENLVSK